jgi:hypothetical protein
MSVELCQSFDVVYFSQEQVTFKEYLVHMSQLNQCLAMALQLQVAFLLLEKANQKTTKKQLQKQFFFLKKLKKIKKFHVQ